VDLEDVMDAATTGHTGRVIDRLQRRSKISTLPAEAAISPGDYPVQDFSDTL
jgi:hypothetical protein